MGAPNKETPAPTEIKLHQKSRLFEIAFADGKRFNISYEMLRVYSPSAEVRGHGPSEENLQMGKRNVEIKEVEPIGVYAIKPVFSDGHESGLYAWDYLYWLGSNQDQLWQDYLDRLEAAGASREPDPNPKPKFPAKLPSSLLNKRGGGHY